MKNIDHIYTAYAEDVVSGKITACSYVQMACKRYLSWFDRNDIEFRTDKVDRVVNFISKLKHCTGSFKGKTFKLEPWQFFVICGIFGWYYKGTEKRVTKYVYIEVARKNGKTALIAAILLYMLIGDSESGAECDLLANSFKQANICYEMCSNMLQSIDPTGKYFKRYRDTIKFDRTKSKLQVLSSEASGLDGFNASAWVLDECHEQPNSRLFDVMCSSQGMRKNPLGIIITTAGFNIFGFCYNYRNTCIDVLNGSKQNDSLFSLIYTLDEKDDWRDPEVWAKSNPMLDVTVTTDYISQQILNAKNNPELENGIRTKNLNQWLIDSSLTEWISREHIGTSSTPIDLNMFPKGTPCYIGVDLSQISDLTAMSVLIPHEDKVYFKNFYYLPYTALTSSPNKEFYRELSDKGHLIITPSETVDYDYIINDMLRLRDHFRIIKIGYDAYNAKQFQIDAKNQRLPMEAYSQALWAFNMPTKELERLILNGKCVIDDNPLTRWCFANVAIKEDHNSNVKPIKYSRNLKIDGVIAMIEALGIFLLTPQYNSKIY